MKADAGLLRAAVSVVATLAASLATFFLARHAEGLGRRA